jgi:hypothetical protein
VIATPLGNGLHELETPSGLRIKTALPADKLQAIGYSIAPPPTVGPDLRLAENDAAGVGGAGGIPEQRSDATIGGVGSGAGGMPNAGAGGGVEGSAQIPTSGGAGAPAARGDRPEVKPPKGEKREGGETEMELRTAPQQHYAPAKAQDVRVGYSTHTNAATPMLPEINKKIEGAEGMREQALQQKAMAEGVSSGQQSELVGSEAERYRREIAEQEAKTRELQTRQADYEQRQNKLDAEREATDKLEVDPNRLTKNQGFFAKAASVIGLLAGGALSGLRGGPNQAAEYLHRAIREDIDDQRERIDARRKGLSVRQTQLERLTDLLHGDQQLAERELEAQHLAHFAARAQQIAADSNSRQVQGNLMGAVADAQQKAAEIRGEVNSKFGEQRSESFKRIVTGGPPAAHKLSPAELVALEGVRSARAANARVRATWEKGGKGGVYRTGLGASSTSHQMDAEAESAAAALAKARGGRVNSEMLDRIKKGYLSASPEVIGQHLEATDRELADRESAILSGASGIGAEGPGVPSARADTGEEEEP